ncbi:MAG TPA: phospholipid-binding protein [Xanthobacteraceae bacterium]
MKGNKMLSRLLIAVAVVAALPSAATAMSLKFSWAGYRACSSRSPAFGVSDVPGETARLAFKMVDKEVPTYPHGGGTVAYRGKGEIPAGAFSYKGPCPPSGQQHTYEWTVQALDRDGKAIGSATAAEPFPPR